MFGPITVSFGAKMLFNTVKLKPRVTLGDVEMAVGELCTVVRERTEETKADLSLGRCSSFPASCRTRAPSRNPERATTIMR